MVGNIAIIFISLLLGVIDASILGIDFGTQYMKIAIVRPGSPFEIVTDLSSKRKTPSAIAFDENTRSYGYDAINMGARRPKSVFQRMARMIGQGPDSVFSEEFKELKFPYEFKLTGRNTWAVKFPKNVGFDDVEYLTAEEINAMVLNYARKLGEAFDNGQKIVDCVVTVPAYFTYHERQAILDTASLIGLNVLSLIDETTAAALQYTVNKEFVNKTHRVMFYDMGAGSIQVAIAEFNTKIDKKTKLPRRYFDVLSKAWDENLGGAFLSQNLADKFAEDFVSQHNLDPRGNLKAEYRLRSLGERMKEMLSVNEKLPVNEGTLFEERDLSTMATKHFIQELSEQYVERLVAPAQKALNDAGLTVNDLQAIEVIGGSIRVPAFQKALREGLHRDILDMHMNGDETVALGAAFRAANVSTAFKPRFVGMSDICPFSISVDMYRSKQEAEPIMEEEAGPVEEAPDTEDPVLDVEEEKQQYDFLLKVKKTHRAMELFARGSHYKTQKKITLQAYEDFQVHLFYSNPDELPEHAVVPIATYNITGIADGIASLGEKRLGHPNVTLVFTNDLNGIVSLKEAFMKMRFQYQEEVEVEKPKNVLKNEEGKEIKDDKEKTETKENKENTESKENAENTENTENTENKENKETTESKENTENKEEVKSEGENMDAKNETEPITAEHPEEAKVEEPPAKETVLVTKRKVRKVNLRLFLIPDRLVILPMTEEERHNSIALLKRMQKRDDDNRERQRIINQHEAFIYDSQSRLENEEFIEFSSEEEREEISKLLSDNEDWLMDEATNETPAEEYKQRYLDMKTAMNRVENRIDEHKRKLEEERKAKEEAERKAKEEAERKAKEEAEKAAEAAKNATEAAEGAAEGNTEGNAKEEAAENAASSDVPESSDATASEASEKSAEAGEPAEEASSTEPVDEGMCSLDGCSDDNSDL